MMSESGNAYRWNRARAAFIAAGMEITQNGDYEGCATFDPGNATQVKEAIDNCAPIRRFNACDKVPSGSRYCI
jgi:hypothetical protein